MLESVKLKNMKKPDNKNKSIVTIEKEAMYSVAKSVVRYINMKEGRHNMYGYGYFFCKVKFLNLGISIV